MPAVKEMTSGRSMPLIFNFAMPLLLGNMLQQTYSIVDAAIVGQFLGINALASVGASTSVIFLILGFCNGCCGGFAIPVAQKFGAHDYVAMRRLVSTSLRIASVFSVVIAVITCLMCPHILHWMQTPDIIFKDANAYLFITFIGIPATFYYNLISSIIRALGDSKTPFWFLLFSTVLNVVLDLVCILILKWGVAGAAIATVFSQALSAVLCYIYMMRKFSILKAETGDSGFHLDLAKTLIFIGVPMGLQFSITAIGSIMLQSSNNALGESFITAFTAAMRIKMFCMTPLESLGMAMATYCGQNYGAGKPDRIWDGIKSAAKMMVIYSLAMMVILFSFSRYFALLFIAPSEVLIIGYVERFVHVSVSFFPILGTLCILRYSIQGAGYTQLAMFSGVSEMIARILVSVIAVPVWGYWAVCFGDPTAWICAVAFLVPAFIYIYRRLQRIIATPVSESKCVKP
jgi:putative MATE family efflux protein